jgi:coenzyme F420 hydrogenase subunit beta
MEVSAITGMDIPPPPAEILVVRTSQGEKHFPLREIRRLIPHTCFICPDMTAEWCDVSVGMYEGRSGWNTLLVRSSAGAELVDRAADDGWLVVEAFPGEREQALSVAALAKKERSMRNALRHGHLQLDNSDSRPSLRVPREVLDRILDMDRHR